MEHHTQELEDIRLYLLGLLSQERRQPLEERLLTEAALYEEMLIVEDELIDQYLAGELTERERGGFEAHFMNASDRRQQVRFARSLRHYIAAEGTVEAAEPSADSADGAQTIKQRRSLLSWWRVRSPARALSLAAAALVLVCGVSWMVMRSLRPDMPHQVLTVILTPDVHTRADGDMKQIVIPTGTDAVRLQLRLTADEFQSYGASLLTAEGTTVVTIKDLKSERAGNGQLVIVNVPTQAMPVGEYQLRLNGVYADGRYELADSYRFRVVSR